MLNPEAIKTQLLVLPILSEWERPKFDRKRYWEGNTLGGHFHFFGCTGQLWDPATGDFIYAVGYKLHVSGSEQARARVAAAFTDVLGEPRNNVRQRIKEIMGRQPDKKYTTLTWLQPEDELVPNRARYGILAESSIMAYFLETSCPADLGEPSSKEIGPVHPRFLTSGKRG